MSVADIAPSFHHFPSKARRLLLENDEIPHAERLRKTETAPRLLLPITNHRRTASSVSNLSSSDAYVSSKESALDLPEPPKTAGGIPWGGVSLFPPAFASHLDLHELPSPTLSSGQKHSLQKSLATKRSYHTLLSSIVKNRRKPSSDCLTDSTPNTPTTPKGQKSGEGLSFVRKFSERLTGVTERSMTPDSPTVRKYISSPKPPLPPKDSFPPTEKDSSAPRSPIKSIRTKVRPAPLQLTQPPSPLKMTSLSYDTSRRPRQAALSHSTRNGTLDSPPIYSFGDAYEVPRSPYGANSNRDISPTELYKKAEKQLSHLQELSAVDDDLDVVLPSGQVLTEHGVQVPGDDESELHFRHKKHRSSGTGHCSISHDLEEAYKAFDDMPDEIRRAICERYENQQSEINTATGRHPLLQPTSTDLTKSLSGGSAVTLDSCRTPKAIRPTPRLATARLPTSPLSNFLLPPQTSHSTPSTPRRLKPVSPISIVATNTPTLAERIEATTPTPTLDKTFYTAALDCSSSVSYNSCWSDTDDDSFDMSAASLEHMQSNERVSVIEQLVRPSAPPPPMPTLRSIRSANDLRSNVAQCQSRYANVMSNVEQRKPAYVPPTNTTKRHILQSAKSYECPQNAWSICNKQTLQERRERRRIRADGLLMIETHSNPSLQTASSSSASITTNSNDETISSSSTSITSSTTATEEDVGAEPAVRNRKIAFRRSRTAIKDHVTPPTSERGYDQPPLTSRFSFDSVLDAGFQAPHWHPSRSKTPLRELLRAAKVTTNHF